jgi:hypothetical protein
MRTSTGCAGAHAFPRRWLSAYPRRPKSNFTPKRRFVGPAVAVTVRRPLVIRRCGQAECTRRMPATGCGIRYALGWVPGDSDSVGLGKLASTASFCSIAIERRRFSSLFPLTPVPLPGYLSQSPVSLPSRPIARLTTRTPTAPLAPASTRSARDRPTGSSSGARRAQNSARIVIKPSLRPAFRPSQPPNHRAPLRHAAA